MFVGYSYKITIKITFVFCLDLTMENKSYIIISYPIQIQGKKMKRGFAMINIKCPKCGCNSGTHINADTVLIRFPLFCKRCKQTTIITTEPEPKCLSRKPS